MAKRKITIKQMADQQFSTISVKNRRKLGITKSNFRSDFAKELRYIRKKRLSK